MKQKYNPVIEPPIIKFKVWDNWNEVFYYSDKHLSVERFWEFITEVKKGGNELSILPFSSFVMSGMDIYFGDIISQRYKNNTEKLLICLFIEGQFLLVDYPSDFNKLIAGELEIEMEYFDKIPTENTNRFSYHFIGNIYESKFAISRPEQVGQEGIPKNKTARKIA